ncbi:hypothetical protein ACFLVC_01475 [Chloroflexota bacterium]
MEKKETNKKPYRVVQIEGKMSFRIEELWDDGVERGPYGSKEAAKSSEEKIAGDNGFIDDLVLQDIIEEKKSPIDSFERDHRGVWLCKEGCAIEMGNKVVVFTEGMTFTKGVPFMGIDVAEWLDKNP